MGKLHYHLRLRASAVSPDAEHTRVTECAEVLLSSEWRPWFPERHRSRAGDRRHALGPRPWRELAEVCTGAAHMSYETRCASKMILEKKVLLKKHKTRTQ